MGGNTDEINSKVALVSIDDMVRGIYRNTAEQKNMHGESEILISG